MRYGLISDVHANLEATRAVLRVDGAHRSGFGQLGSWVSAGGG